MLVFRDQRLSESAQIAFTAALGEPDTYTLGEYRSPRHPEILLVSNIREGGRNIGLADAGTTWHTDSSYLEVPPHATVLYAVEVPEAGGRVLGDTLFASAAAAYDALDDALKTRLDGLVAVHSYHAKHQARAALGRSERNAPSATEERVLAPVEHPVVRTHPRSGRKAIYVSAGECTGILGMGADEALALLEALAAHVVEPRFRHHHRWRAGDLVIWDNCQLQHLAIKDYALPQRRLMHRTQIRGSRPV
jgi:taurine dioxygenase